MFMQFLTIVFNKLFFMTGAIREKNCFPKPLSPEEEKHYLTLVREQDDKQAKDILIQHNMRLVAHIVKKYHGSAELDDLIAVGSIGLIKAINTYKEGHGTQLATYTARCIENEILMLLRSSKKHKNTVYLTDPIGVDKEGNELTLMDLLYEKEESLFKTVENNLIREKFVAILEKHLSKREFLVVSMRYGLLTGVGMPQREVATTLKISRSYISRIEKKALEKVRDSLSKNDYI